MATVEKKSTTDQKSTSGTYGPWGPQAVPSKCPCIFMQPCNTHTHTHTHTYTNRHTAHKQTNTNSQGIARQLESTDQQDYISSERPATDGHKAGSLVIDKEGVLM